MDTEIEGMARECELCQQSRGLPSPAPLHPWVWPSAPWSRIHLDYAGPIAGQMFLVSVNPHSKWLEVFHVSAATSFKTIHQLRTTFALFGLPHTVMTDNGSCFTSEEFEVFLAKNGVRHVKTAPYHPSSNAQAERAVQVFKNGYKKMKVPFLIVWQDSRFVQDHTSQHNWVVTNGADACSESPFKARPDTAECI